MAVRVEYHNGTGLLAVIGDPIAHSLSPLLQNTMISALGHDRLYLALRVEKGQLPEFLRAARLLGIEGFNLTMPHKEDILPHLSDMTPEARAAGSVNTVRREGDRFYGHSTDGLGFRRALQDLGFDFPGRRVTLLGAGGAARSIAMTALAAGAETIRVVNRTPERAQAICAGHGNMLALSLSDREAALRETDILINTTPVGMAGTGTGGDFSFLSALPEGAPAVDCIYAPARTPFMASAAALGHPVANGIGMLVYQAVLAYAFFIGQTFPEETVTELGRRLLDAAGIPTDGLE